jgi:hypothetical protein
MVVGRRQVANEDPLRSAVRCASVLLYFGSGILRQSGYSYGVLPTAASVAILILAAWLWSQSREVTNLGKSIVAAFLSAIGAVALFWIVVIITTSLRP